MILFIEIHFTYIVYI